MERQFLPLLKKYLGCVLIQVLVFYALYPQALAIMGSSALRATGVIGLLLYAFFKFPYLKDVIIALSVYGLFVLIAFTSGYLNGIAYDEFIISFTNSQVAWFFTTFMIIYLIFRVHEKPTLNMLLMYIVGAVALQCIITLLMYFNRDVNDYLFSLQLHTEKDIARKNHFEKERLIGYGIAFFGAGIVAGYGLVTLAYIIVKENLKRYQLIIAAFTYVLIFYVGLFSARTTIIGFSMSLILIAYHYMFVKKTNQKQLLNILGIVVVLLLIGVSLVYAYFPDFTDWAFELFTTFANTGKVQTYSSAGLTHMFYMPDNYHTMMIGTGDMEFFGSDVGFTRLMFYVGIPGMLILFMYTLNLIRMSWTKDNDLNLFFIYIFLYMLVMNIKGFAELNVLFCLFFFYFLFYKNKFYYPKLANYNQAVRQQRLKNTN